MSSQGKSFGNRNVNKNVNDNSNSDFDFLSSFLDSVLAQQERKGKAAKAANGGPSVPIAPKSAVAKSADATVESPAAAATAAALSRSLPDTITTAQQQQDQQAFDQVETLADDEFVDDISAAFDDSEQEESPFSAAQLKFFQSLMKG